MSRYDNLAIKYCTHNRSDIKKTQPDHIYSSIIGTVRSANATSLVATQNNSGTI